MTDRAIWCLLLHKPGLHVLRYHQAYSVAEILCRESVVFKTPQFLLPDDIDENEYFPSEKRTKFMENNSNDGISRQQEGKLSFKINIQ